MKILTLAFPDSGRLNEIVVDAWNGFGNDRAMIAGFRSASAITPEVAEQYAEMYDGAAKGLLVPAGDRLVQGKTTLDDTIKEVLAAGAPTH